MFCSRAFKRYFATCCSVLLVKDIFSNFEGIILESLNISFRHPTNIFSVARVKGVRYYKDHLYDLPGTCQGSEILQGPLVRPPGDNFGTTKDIQHLQRDPRCFFPVWRCNGPSAFDHFAAAEKCSCVCCCEMKPSHNPPKR